MAHEKQFTAKQVALSVLDKVKEMLSRAENEKTKKLEELKKSELETDFSNLTTLLKGETKHDRCVEHVKENSPEVKNPHAVCVAEGVKPEKWKKGEVLEKKYEGFKAVEESARKSGASDPAAVAAAVGRKKYGKQAFQEAAAHGHKMGKAENPDKEADAKLGEKVEHEVEEHMLENKDAERKEGHKIAKSDTENSKKLGNKPENKHVEEKQPEKSDKAFEVKSGSSKSSDDARQSEQAPPQENTHEQAEGNNPPAGETPKDGIEQNEVMKGHLKLAKFIGRMEQKRISSKKDQSRAR